MYYAVFRSAVLGLLRDNSEWSVKTDWGEALETPAGSLPSGEGLEDFIELEQEKGPFYVFMTVSVNRLFVSYQEEGWDAVVRELERYTLQGRQGARRVRGIDYEARLTDEGAELYGRLRSLRSELARTRQIPPYFIFMNRSLYEMCCRQPADMEELRAIYGVGEKNSRTYGAQFLSEIREFTGGEKRLFMKMPPDALAQMTPPDILPPDVLPPDALPQRMTPDAFAQGAPVTAPGVSSATN